MFIRNPRGLTDFWSKQNAWIVNGIKISEDNDKRVVFDESTSYFLKLMAPEYGLYEEAVVVAVTTSAVAHYTAVDYEYRVGKCNTVDGDAVVQFNAYPLGGRMYIVGSTTTESIFNVEGYAPHGCIPIWCGDQDDISDWYDVRRVGSLVARLKAGSLGGTATARFCVQQYRTY